MNRLDGATRPLACMVVAPFGTLGGSEYWLLDLLDRSPRLEANVVLLQDGPLRRELHARGVATTVVPTGRRAGALVARSWHLSRLLVGAPVDVVLANGVKAAAVAVPAARMAGVPVVWAKHDFSWDRRLARPLGWLSDGVLANSEAVASAAHRRDAVVVPPARPQHVASRAEALDFWRRIGHPPPYGRTVAMVGRLVPYKGIDTGIRALAEPGGRSWSLVVVGPDDPSEADEARRLRQLAAELRVSERVHLVPEVREAGRVLSAFDAVAVLTRQEASGFGREGYSLVALEALAAGVPLIGAEGNPEVVRMASAAGALVPPDDPAALARALSRLDDPQRRAELGARGRELISAHPDAETCAAEISGLLAQVAGRPGAGLCGPPVTVVTCLKNEEGHVDGVLEAVIGQMRPDDEYLVVDDDSTDATATEVRRWADADPRLRVISGPGINLSAARNRGFAAARHEVVACTDAGCAPRPGWLDALRASFAETTPPDLVVGVFSVPGGDPVRDAFALAGFPSVTEARRRTPFVRVAGRLFGRSFAADRLDGRSMAVTVSAWRAAGGFDESLFSSEDAVFGHAVLATGGRSVLSLDAEVVWEQPTDMREMAKTFARYGEWGARAHDWRLVRRDLLRASAYLIGPALAVRGGPTARRLLAAGTAAYLAPPVVRAARVRAGLPSVALIPLALGLKDLAKAWGCLHGLSSRSSVAQREVAEPPTSRRDR